MSLPASKYCILGTLQNMINIYPFPHEFQDTFLDFHHVYVKTYCYRTFTEQALSFAKFLEKEMSLANWTCQRWNAFSIYIFLFAKEP